MIAVVTGDLINSASLDTSTWLPALKAFLSEKGKYPKFWEISRGDFFQFRCDAPAVLYEFLLLKSMIKEIPDLDVRASIGIGSLEYDADRISESNGSAFVRSGRAFDQLTEKQNLVLSTGDEQLDRTMDLMIRFAALIMDNWTVAVAQTIHVALKNPEWNQHQIAEKLNINQSAVSQNRKRGQLDLLLDLNEYFKNAITQLNA